MADLIKSGYGQIELNRCSFLHDGNIESQCEATEDIENGAIVVVDKAAKTVRNAKVADFTADGVLLGVSYTTEKIYNQFTPGRKHFRTEKGAYPRVGYFKAGDVFSTNVMLTTGNFAAIEAGQYWKGETTVEAGAPEKGPKLLVAEVTDTADGQDALKIQVL